MQTIPFSALLAAILLTGCASMSSGTTESTVATQTFLAPKAQVVTATQTTITGLGYTLKEIREASPTTTIYFSKPLTSLSWSKSGKVTVTGQTPTITDVSTKDGSSAKIFKTIRHNLPQ